MGEEARRQGEEGRERETEAERARPWVKWLARWGYYARGSVYLVLGLIAVRAAFSRGGEAEGPGGAMLEIFRQPLGRWLLAGVALGLLVYAVWRWVQAVLDPDDEGSDLRGISGRAGHAVSGTIYGLLAVQAVLLVVGMGDGGDGGGDEQAEHWSAVALEQPAGRWLLGAAGVLIAVFGATEFWVAYTVPFMRLMHGEALGERGRAAVRTLGRVGLVARGMVSVLIGVLVVRAALDFDPSEAAGLEGALEEMAGQPFGPLLLGAVGAGIAAYGVFQFVEGRYRKINKAW
jgi:hypothetical protein